MVYYILLFLFFIYGIFEIINFIKYNKFKKEVESQLYTKKNLYLSDKNEKRHIGFNILNLIEYLNNTNKNNITKIIEQLFYDKIKITEIRFVNLYEALCYYIYNQLNLSFQKSQTIFSLINNIEQKIGFTFKRDFIKQEYIKVTRNKFQFWYQPFILIIIKYFLKLLFHLFMKILKFESYKENNLIIYTNNNLNKKNVVLFHCSVAGALSLILLIKRMKNDYNLIIPEIPGLSWNYYYDLQKINNLDYYNDIVINFIKRKNLNNLNLICHSLGGITCLKFYNQIIFKNPFIKINNIFFCEAPAFPIYIFKLHSESYDIFKSIKYYIKNCYLFDLLIIPFLQRDIYVQYYVNMDINTFDSCFFYKESDTKIHLILVDKDSKIPTDFYLDYLQNKNLLDKIETKLFFNSRHGSFLYKKNIQDYLIEKLN